MKNRHLDLGDFLDREVYPRLFDRLDSAFPNYGWTKKGDHWIATRDETRDLEDSPRPARVYCYRNRPWCLIVQGGKFVRLLDLVNGGRKPTGPDFVEAVRKLADLAGATMPEREEAEADRQERERKERREDALEVVLQFCQETLWSTKGEKARTYLRDERGFTDEHIRDLGLGLYLDAAKVSAYAVEKGVDPQALQDSALTWDKLEGYITYPWNDEYGKPLTIYGRWHTKTPPEGRPKTIALPGEGTKRSPLYFDRARAAGLKELVLVEGVNDTALLQVLGDARVVAAVGAQLSGLQLKTLERHRVRKVFICGDPDRGGDRGTVANIKSLEPLGIETWVVPRLPDDLDPDEFVLREGVEKWKSWVEQSTRGTVFRAVQLLEGVTPASPDTVKREAVHEVANYLERDLRGEWAKVDEESIVHEVVERTGYGPEALEEVFSAASERGRQEATEKDLDRLLRHAHEDRSKDRPAGDVALDLASKLVDLRSRTIEAPPAFSVDRLVLETRRTPQGISSGWTTLDALEVKFNPGELALVGARTGHGKTTFLVHLLWNWLQAGGDGKLVFYSAEEPEVRIFHRLVSLVSTKSVRDSWTGAEVRDFLRDPLSRGAGYRWPGNQAHLLEHAHEVRSFEDRLLVVHRPAWNVEDLAAHAHGLAAHDKVDAVVVDYLQRIPPAPLAKGQRIDRRDQEISLIGRRLKALAEELSAPVVAAAQINRAAIPEQMKKDLRVVRADFHKAVEILKQARPDLHNLREGGSEQEADLVLGLMNYAADFRQEVDPATRFTKEDGQTFGVGTLKNRYGATGQWAELLYTGRFGLLEEVDFSGITGR